MCFDLGFITEKLPVTFESLLSVTDNGDGGAVMFFYALDSKTLNELSYVFTFFVTSFACHLFLFV